MRKDQVYPSKYLKATDLRGRDVTVEIADVEFVTLQGKPSTLVYFKGKSKALVVKPAIWDQIERVTGEPDSDSWVGHEITLFPTETDFAGVTYDVIRVRTNGKRPAPPTRTAAVEEPDDDIPNEPDDSDIPF